MSHDRKYDAPETPQERECAGERGMNATRVTTIRLSEQSARDAELVARIEHISLSEFIRAAVDARVRESLTDPDFRVRLGRRIEDDRTILDRLGGVG